MAAPFLPDFLGESRQITQLTVSKELVKQQFGRALFNHFKTLETDGRNAIGCQVLIALHKIAHKTLVVCRINCGRIARSRLRRVAALTVL
jgi:hypothetical protein